MVDLIVGLLYSEAADYIYANIPDLPKHFRPSALRRAGHATTNDEEKIKGKESRKGKRKRKWKRKKKENHELISLFISFEQQKSFP